MYKIRLLNLLMIVITVCFALYSHINCNIIPYTKPTGQDKEIVITHYIYTFPGRGPKPIAGTAAVISIDNRQETVRKQPKTYTDSSPDFVPAAGTQCRQYQNVQKVDTVPDTGRQGDSRVLLSGSGAASAISSLAFKDKLWFLRILGRCSIEELRQITGMLQDGVTYDENLAMYKILRDKVTDEEQKKLDSLIESYTRQ